MIKHITLLRAKLLSTAVIASLSFASISQDLSITVDVCNAASEVRMTGPFWGWDPTGGPFAVDNLDGTWTFTLSPAPTADMEYLIIADQVQENLVADMQNGGTCAPVTDYFSYANRIWSVGDGNVTGISYDRCVSCAVEDLVITTTICDTTLTPNQLNLTGPLWGWNPAFGPQAVNNGNGTWTFTVSPSPSDSLEYLLVLDGTMESLVGDMQNGGTCAPLTDYFSYANRLWVNGDGSINNTYDHCVACEFIGIEENAFEALSVYPIPANDIITISDETTIGNVAIHSVVGQKILEMDMNTASGSINISDLTPGVYYLTVSRDGASSVHQIVKN